MFFFFRQKCVVAPNALPKFAMEPVVVMGSYQKILAELRERCLIDNVVRDNSFCECDNEILGPIRQLTITPSSRRSVGHLVIYRVFAANALLSNAYGPDGVAFQAAELHHAFVIANIFSKLGVPKGVSNIVEFCNKWSFTVLEVTGERLQDCPQQQQISAPHFTEQWIRHDHDTVCTHNSFPWSDVAPVCTQGRAQDALRRLQLHRAERWPLCRVRRQEHAQGVLSPVGRL
ncbi:hypothetical protein J6590_036689 [Homalodisca vitripennis]|nr:hypothetical protein J6590_036689 [Homalodisca vitripennis]